MRPRYSTLSQSVCRPRHIIAFGICLVITVTLFISMKAHHHEHTQSGAHPHLVQKLSLGLGLGLTQLLEVVCKHALFPDTCTRELSSFSIPVIAEPSHIVSLSVQAAAKRADEALLLATQCSAEPGLHILETQCAHDCIELMEDTKVRLGDAVSKLSDLNVRGTASLESYLMDVKVWLSSALSYQTACTDGFNLAPGSVQTQIEDNQDYLAEVIGNGLALVDTLSQVGDSLSSWLGALAPLPPYIHLRRRLLSRDGSHNQLSSHDARMISDPGDQDFFAVRDGFPHWVSSAERKLLQAPSSSATADAVVAQDGSGDFLTITDALQSIPPGYTGRYVIYIKGGVYAEVFNVTRDVENITLMGDGIGYTVITGAQNVASGLFNTYRTSTVGISSTGFFARDITFQNTAGPGGHQAVALRAQADFLVFYRCSFEGYQDTLYALSSRQFYRECKISGTVDFIFGNAIAVFQDCEIIARLPLQAQKNTVTAQGRKLSADVSGYSFQNCTIYGESDLLSSSYSVPTYLGRPWKAYSRVVFLQSEMEALVDPEGWLPWNESNPFIDTLYYGEYDNRGPGSDTTGRVQWPGVHPTLTLDEAEQFDVENFLAGETWLGPYDVAYQSTLS